jgi:hypothetical protein
VAPSATPKPMVSPTPRQTKPADTTKKKPSGRPGEIED